jgi:hypothetical protein
VGLAMELPVGSVNKRTGSVLGIGTVYKGYKHERLDPSLALTRRGNRRIEK